MYVLGAFFMSTMIRAATWSSFPALDKELMSEEYIDYFPLARYSQLAYNFDAFLLLGATLKVAKYLQLIEGADMIARVFSFAASNLGFVVIFFALIFYGFVNLAQQIFGTLPHFSGPTDTTTELLFMVLSKMDRAPQLFAQAPLWGPMFMTLFILLLYFSVNTLFLAVLCSSFTVNREKRDKEFDQKAAALAAKLEQMQEQGQRPLTIREKVGGNVALLVSLLVSKGKGIVLRKSAQQAGSEPASKSAEEGEDDAGAGDEAEGGGGEGDNTQESAE